MKDRKLFWHLYPSYLLVAMIALFIMGLLGGVTFKNFYYKESLRNLKITGNFIAREISGEIRQNGNSDISALCARLKREAHVNLIVKLSGGEIIGLTETFKKDSISEQFPLIVDGKVLGTINIFVTLNALHEELQEIYIQVAIAGTIFILLIAGISWPLSYNLSRPLQVMKKTAEFFAKGDFSKRVLFQRTAPYELKRVGHSMNKMAIQLDQRLRTIIGQKKEQEAILASMIEGVLTISTDGTIIQMNSAACKFFQVDPNSNFIGATVKDVIPMAVIGDLTNTILSTGVVVEDEITIPKKDKNRILQVHGSPLRLPGKEMIGALIFFYDATRLYEFEQHRKDFVANVSHELRTPITAVKGFVETLLYDEERDKENTDRFLNIILKQTDRLNAIITDLLTLSRIEKETEHEEIEKHYQTMLPILESVAEMCDIKLKDKNITLDLQCSSDIQCEVNGSLIEQAIINLVDNAIKYSPKGSTITVHCQATLKEVVFTVKDRGAGIPKEHLPRLFERFYRVDKARSRKLGGTGLGLSIVKHIVRAHNGKITVDSDTGLGVTFEIYLPV
jgi:two-component system phosphate regulon sensor histidine kinase PhoR